jgi:FkbM family methyltransferase
MRILGEIRILGKIRILRKSVIAFSRLIYSRGRVVTIRFGPLSNYKWVCNEDHQFWMPLGLYERETTKWLMKSIKSRDVFFDVGANAGYFSLLGSKYVGEEGKVISFEPIPLNCKIIEEHLVANNVNTVVVENLAVSKDTGTVNFTIEHNNPTSHMESISITHAPVSPKDTIQVNSISLDEYIIRHGIAPNIIKVDVEGAEKLVLEGSTALLRDLDADWIISTHSSELYKECQSIMEQNNYEIEALKGFHHELICKKNIRTRSLQR